MKQVVLITALGTVTASSIATELKKEDKYYIIGADINQKYEIATSLDVDEFYSFPLAADSSYIDFILDFCKEHHVCYYYAVLDKEVVNLAKHKADFDAIGVKLCIVNSEFAEICHYKDGFAKWIDEHVPDVGVKTYRVVAEIHDGDFPLFVKPIEGAASVGCSKIDSMEQLKSTIRLELIGKELIVQEYVEGRNITVDLIRNKTTGQKTQIQRVELLRNGNGCGIAVEIIHNKKLEDICNQLMEKLDLNGVCNAEFFDCGNDSFKIIEINPRFSAGTRYSCLAGINTVKNAMLIADGKACMFGVIAYGKHFAERYEAYQMD